MLSQFLGTQYNSILRTQYTNYLVPIDPNYNLNMERALGACISGPYGAVAGGFWDGAFEALLLGQD